MTAKQITIRETKAEINYVQQGQGDKTLLFMHGWCIDGTYDICHRTLSDDRKTDRI